LRAKTGPDKAEFAGCGGSTLKNDNTQDGPIFAATRRDGQARFSISGADCFLSRRYSRFPVGVSRNACGKRGFLERVSSMAPLHGDAARAPLWWRVSSVVTTIASYYETRSPKKGRTSRILATHSNRKSAFKYTPYSSLLAPRTRKILLRRCPLKSVNRPWFH
jgi:hypothetical protein